MVREDIEEKILWIKDRALEGALMLLLILTIGVAYGCSAYGHPIQPVYEQYRLDRNKLTNPGFENGKSTWSTSGSPTFSITTTTANVADGTRAASFDAGAASDKLISDAWTMEAGAQSKNCLGRIRYKGGDSNLTFSVTDGTNTLSSVALATQSGWVTETLNYICPSSGYSRLEVEAGADAAVAYIDDAYIGLAGNIREVSDAAVFGTLQYAATSNCEWSTTSTSAADYAADSDCPTPTVTGFAEAPGTKVPQVDFTNAPAGEYVIAVTGSSQHANSQGSSKIYILADEDNTVLADTTRQTNVASNTFITGLNLIGKKSLTSPGDISFKVRGYTQNGAETNVLPASTTTLTFVVMYYPAAPLNIVNLETLPWKVDANISGGSPSLGTSDVSTYTGLTDSGLTLTNNTGYGNLTAQIPCSSTNAPTGTTCSSGDESVGVVFDLPRTGDVLACVSFANEVSGTTYRAKQIFQIVETPTNAQTISQEGKSRVQYESTGVGSGINSGQAFRVCGTFSFSSAGTKALRLFYEQRLDSGTLTGSTVMGDASASEGQRDIHWEVYPINQAFPLPVVLNQVQTTASAGVTTEKASIDCDSGSSVNSQLGSWVSSVGNISGGACVVTLSAGVFSATPLCTASDIDVSGTPNIISVTATSATSVTIDCAVHDSTACTTFDAVLSCSGAR